LELVEDQEFGKQSLKLTVPKGSPIFDLNEIWLKELANNFIGNVIVGKDLLQINYKRGFYEE
tara:strand:- start:713 stop:898 length:186 start_codon:yes stop_codon:yes gene_type:complete